MKLNHGRYHNWVLTKMWRWYPTRFNPSMVHPWLLKYFKPNGTIWNLLKESTHLSDQNRFLNSWLFVLDRWNDEFGCPPKCRVGHRMFVGSFHGATIFGPTVHFRQFESMDSNRISLNLNLNLIQTSQTYVRISLWQFNLSSTHLFFQLYYLPFNNIVYQHSQQYYSPHNNFPIILYISINKLELKL